MLTTRYVDGAPNWLDLGTPDPGAATYFYSALFGWTFRPSERPEASGYGFFELDGRVVAGAMHISVEQASPSWTVYFRTSDADATADAVRAVGGHVGFRPMAVYDQGRLALFSDRSGASFGCWQPGATEGLGVVGEDNSLCWVEHYGPTVEDAVDFYRAVYGWNVYEVPAPGGSYTTLGPAGEGEDRMFGGAIDLAERIERGSAAHWLPYFAVDDPDAVCRRAREQGGSVRMEPTDLEGVGRLAKLGDPWGARFAVLKPLPPESRPDM
ncbi:VOC family protein [Streptomyces albidoflavus]